MLFLYVLYSAGSVYAFLMSVQFKWLVLLIFFIGTFAFRGSQIMHINIIVGDRSFF